MQNPGIDITLPADVLMIRSGLAKKHQMQCEKVVTKFSLQGETSVARTKIISAKRITEKIRAIWATALLFMLGSDKTIT